MASENKALRAVIGILHVEQIRPRRPERFFDEENCCRAVCIKPSRRQHLAVENDLRILAEILTKNR